MDYRKVIEEQITQLQDAQKEMLSYCGGDFSDTKVRNLIALSSEIRALVSEAKFEPVGGSAESGTEVAK